MGVVIYVYDVNARVLQEHCSTTALGCRPLSVCLRNNDAQSQWPQPEFARIKFWFFQLLHCPFVRQKRFTKKSPEAGDGHVTVWVRRQASANNVCLVVQDTHVANPVGQAKPEKEKREDTANRCTTFHCSLQSMSSLMRKLRARQGRLCCQSHTCETCGKMSGAHNFGILLPHNMRAWSMFMFRCCANHPA